MNKFWMVWSPQGNTPTYKHATYESARDEAIRLARVNPGKRFYVLTATEYYEVNDVRMVVLGSGDFENDIPF